MTTTSSATFTNAGVGSGLDLETLITNLVAAEKTPTETRLTQKQSTLSAQLSAVGTFKSVLSNLQSKLDALKSDGSVATLSATSSDTSTFTATASSAATRGSYSVEVVGLATPEKLASTGYSSASTALGAGDVTLTVGSKSFTVTLGDTGNSLTDLKNAINNASDNSGVTATLITENGGTHLLLTSNDTGAANAVSVSSSLVSFSEAQAAQDAHVRIDGYDVYSASNTVSDAIDGVALNLVAASPGSSKTLTLAFNNTAATSAIQSFVSAYNSAVTTMSALTKYDASTQTAATLNGDSMVRGAQSSLRNIIGGSVGDAGTFQYLSQIGITTAADGTLSVDSDKLGSALNTDSASVQKLFGNSDGLAAQLDGAINRLIGTDGLVDARDDAINSQLDGLSKQFDDLNARMDQVEARYRAQFTALDTLVASMQSTSTFLTGQLQQIANIGSWSSSKNN
ncbi:flagellar filament capping protein FliD [Solimonas terrae]|uniref:Flagellar hook-associated protein 2 n=1 Tax=Solimonas terrae TaxID=1396819 RepID=A0A6M2BQC8_9GAMM|nr:flagellar filament capping protein FliD [Solimonas terrae]NGY04421.1 flagellar filament capping protein FliD [Solimonas terrae]